MIIAISILLFIILLPQIFWLLAMSLALRDDIKYKQRDKVSLIMTIVSGITLILHIITIILWFMLFV